MQRYFTDLKCDNQFILKRDDLYHIKTVMRLKNNDLIEVVYNNKLHICHLFNDSVIIDKVINEEYNKKKYYILCLPILKEQKMSFVLQKATELGVDVIIPLITSRSIANITEDKKITRWQKIVKEASEQSKRLDIPKIENIKKISDLKLDGLKILCSTTEKDVTLKKVIKKNDKCDKIVLMVGPEGGFTTKEEEILVNLGFIKTTLGRNILRVETVPIYLLSILKYEE